MNIVCDTNTLISGFIFGGKPRTVIQLATQGRVSNFLSPPIIEELDSVLRREKFGLTHNEVFHLIQLARDSFEWVENLIPVQVIQNDPDDNWILATAWAGGAEYIISGDQDLLGLKQWNGIRIVTAAEFLTEFLEV